MSILPPEQDDSEERRALVREMASSLIAKDNTARAAYEAIIERGESKEFAINEIARVFLAVHWHVAHRLTSRDPDDNLQPALARLARGETAADIFDNLGQN